MVRADAVRYRAAIIPSIADDLSAELKTLSFALTLTCTCSRGGCSVPYSTCTYDGVTYVCVYCHRLYCCTVSVISACPARGLYVGPQHEKESN